MFDIKTPEIHYTPLYEGMEGLQSQTIDWLRFPLIVAVVFAHSFGLPSEYDLAAIHADPFSAMSIYNWIRICFSHVVSKIPVPAFFLISGFLFFHKWQEWDRHLYIKKMKRRVRSLVIPYLCWNTISILFIVAAKLGAFFVKGKPLSNISLWIQENGGWHLFWDCHILCKRVNWLGLSHFRCGPYDGPLWFLRDLMVVSILAPLIYWYLRRTRHYGLLLLALAYISGIWPDIDGFHVIAVFFFSVGAYFSIYGKNIVCEFRKVRMVSYISALPLLLVTIWFDGELTWLGSLIFPFYIICGVCAVFNLASHWLEGNRVRLHPLLSQSTFFIYAVHTIGILGMCSGIVRRIICSETALALTIRYLVTPFVATAVCIAIYVLMRRFTPRILGVLTGKR